jgi:hypothetical protein
VIEGGASVGGDEAPTELQERVVRLDAELLLLQR